MGLFLFETASQRIGAILHFSNDLRDSLPRLITHEFKSAIKILGNRAFGNSGCTGYVIDGNCHVRLPLPIANNY